MNRGRVTSDGLRDIAAGRDATTGVHVPDGRGTAPRRRRRRDEAVVPEADFRSYYGQPIINKPTWEAPDIPGYLFLGGLAGGSSLIAAGAHLRGRRALARASKLGSTAAISLSLVALIHDLGRPERFLNMLRMFKVTSPMSVGSWLLAAYGPASFASSALDVTGLLPRVGAAATGGAAALGPAVAAYTGALISNTAVPAWHEGRREMPYLFVASGAAASAGFGLLTAPRRDHAPVRRLAMLAGPAEIALTKAMEKQTGIAQECYHSGKAGRYMRAAEALTAAGTVAAAASRRRGWLARIAGAALLTGSAFTRFGIFEAGITSAEDPKFTVVPQRERLGGSHPSRG